MARRHVLLKMLLASSSLGCAPDLHDPVIVEVLDDSVTTMLPTGLKRIEGTGQRVLEGISKGPDETLLLSGYYTTSIPIDGAPNTLDGAADPFVVSLNSNHAFSLVWSVAAPEPQQAHAIAWMDKADSAFIVGEMSGSMTAGNGAALVSLGGRDAFAASYKVMDGATTWTKQMGGAGYQAATKVAPTANGEVLVAGLFSGPMMLGNEAVASTGGYDVFVLTLDSSGNPSAPLVFGGTSSETLAGVAADADGNSWLVGDYEGSMSVGSKSITSTGTQGIYIIGRTPMGEVKKVLSLEGNGPRHASALAVDTEGNVFVTGSFAGNIGFGGDFVTTEADRGLFVLKLDSAGELLWVRAYGEKGANINAQGIAVGFDGQVSVVADYTGVVSVGKLMFDNKDATDDILVLQLDASGSARKAATLGDDKQQHASGVVVDHQGRTTLIGQFEGKLGVGASEIQSSPDGDPFVLRMQ